jgi:hypothetical protein
MSASEFIFIGFVDFITIPSLSFNCIYILFSSPVSSFFQLLHVITNSSGASFISFPSIVLKYFIFGSPVLSVPLFFTLMEFNPTGKL